MDIKIEKTNNACECKLTALTEGEEWATAQKHALAEIAKNVTVKGFRKGKAPLAQAAKQIPQGEILSKAADKAVEKAYNELIEKNQIRPVLRPELVVNEFNDKKFDFSFIVVTAPEVTLGDYKGIDVEKDKVEVTEEDIQNELNDMAKKDAEMIVLEDDVPAEKGNTVVIDFEGFVDGKAFDGGKAENYELKLGSNTFVPGFEDQLIGVKKGEHKDVVISFPKEYVAELAGKEATFKVTVHEIKKEVLPEINDDFAKDVDIEGVNTLDELKEHVKKTILERKENAAKNKQESDLFEKVVANAQVKIHQKLIDEEAKSIFDNFKQRVETQGYSFDDFLKITNNTEEKLMEEARQEAIRQENRACVLAQIAVAENLTITKEDLDARFEELAKQYNMKKEDLTKRVGDRINDFANNMRTEKVMNFLKENNNLKA